MPTRQTQKSESKSFIVVDDWPDELPITEDELDLLEVHFLDIITAMTQHG